MDDQFGGRTDDDLFYDDFEPVESETVIVSEQPPITPAPTRSPAPVPVSQPQKSPSKPVQGLSSSRFADSPEPPEQTTPPADASAEPADAASLAASGPPSDAPTGPKKRQKGNGRNHKNHQPRAGSGANPRQKLTEDELSAKMQHMKLLNAEKERKFERASQDEKQHAEAYAKGMEEARKRRKEAEERRKRTEETQRKLNDEREKNRERKLKAMGTKEGGSWDEGKVEQLEEERRRGFKGANGGGDLGDWAEHVEEELPLASGAPKVQEDPGLPSSTSKTEDDLRLPSSTPQVEGDTGLPFSAPRVTGRAPKAEPSKEVQQKAGGTWFSHLAMEGDEDDKDTSIANSGEGLEDYGEDSEVSDRGSEDETATREESDYHADDEAETSDFEVTKAKFIATQFLQGKAIAVRKAHATKTLGVALVEMPGDRMTESWLQHVQARSKDVRCTILVRGRRIHSRLVWA
ncbi:uncharacterized protein J7T54_005674 [Emericellopsis cladophorae]|uniref:Uncharacterized protein n=1 Tax=Emericellopsis cladophorae TaxID=2686198 RepID=A0A9P9Y5Y5_9HYPO|nr:uncharacterized protein J7T54_005674 [Emericellopsis cladophorae]KAI6783645.1 hypothetical protein J7T54_005674 [Emericellopsis cladophorae]